MLIEFEYKRARNRAKSSAEKAFIKDTCAELQKMRHDVANTDKLYTFSEIIEAMQSAHAQRERSRESDLASMIEKLSATEEI